MKRTNAYFQNKKFHKKLQKKIKNKKRIKDKL